MSGWSSVSGSGKFGKRSWNLLEKGMIVERSNFYVVAGGPGSGKTALI
jgi:hypothetical protein